MAPFLDLPRELFLIIFDHICDANLITQYPASASLPALASLSGTCRILRAVSLPLLYVRIRLPRTHLPPGMAVPLLYTAVDERALLLAQTFLSNPFLASLVRVLELTPAWSPDDGMERARDAYRVILRSCVNIKALAFSVSRGEYNDVLTHIEGPRNELTFLSIGIDNPVTELSSPLFRPQPPTSLAPSPASAWSNPASIFMQHWWAPRLTHLQLILPAHVALNVGTAQIIRVALPHSIAHLDIGFIRPTFENGILPDEVARLLGEVITDLISIRAYSTATERRDGSRARRLDSLTLRLPPGALNPSLVTAMMATEEMSWHALQRVREPWPVIRLVVARMPVEDDVRNEEDVERPAGEATHRPLAAHPEQEFSALWRSALRDPQRMAEIRPSVSFRGPRVL